MKVGDKVKLVALPPFVKTADPMPMLRSPEVLIPEEEGFIVDRRPGGYWAVKFTNGTFLLDSKYLKLIF